MRDKKAYRTIVCIIGCILLNYLGKCVANALVLPVWLDSAGTVLAAYFYGPFGGAVAGACVNILYGISHPHAYVYALTSIAVGVNVGICAKRGMFRDLFGTMTASFFTAVISVLISTPLNSIFFDGYPSNRWGDAVVDFLQVQGCGKMFSCAAGEFYVDFLDKVCILCVFYAGLSACRRKRRNGGNKGQGRIRAMLLFVGVICVMTGLPVRAADAGEDYGSYAQTIYNGDNGLSSGTATDIEQTEDGILWIGTYNGLYRYNGNSFVWMDEMESVKNVKCLYTDEEGRLWVGTNDSGVSICKDGAVTCVIDEEDGLPSDAIRCIAGGKNGTYYVGTSDRLAVVTLADEVTVTEVFSEILYADSIAVNDDGEAAVVTNEGKLYLVDETGILTWRQCDTEGVGYTCCTFDSDGTLYVGTSDCRVETFSVEGTAWTEQSAKTCGELINIKELRVMDDGDIFVCADNGIGYLEGGSAFQSIHTNQFQSSIDHMLVDYQGNLWFSSSRLGLLKMCRSVFTELYDKLGMEDKVVNAIAEWENDLYIGTDNGLDLMDAGATVQKENALTKQLQDVRIRHLTVDTAGCLWIATTGQGVWQVTPEGEITVYDSAAGTLGDKFRMMLETSDGEMMLAGDSGITCVSDGAVTHTIGVDDGLDNPKVLCMLAGTDGEIMAGTDGNGIAFIEDHKVVRTVKREDGLSSDVILRICADVDGEGYFVITGNGLCYMDADGSVRTLDNFPYYNNFDLMESDGKLFVLCAAGIYVVDKQSLLAGEEGSETLLDGKTGLRGTLTANAWTYEDSDGDLYLPESAGVTKMQLKAYDAQEQACRVQLQTVKVDGVSCAIGTSGQIRISKGAKRIEMIPEVINYLPNDPYVRVQLEGSDTEAQVFRQSELTEVVYSNLPAGSYTLAISVMGKDDAVLSETEYHVSKAYEFYEHKWFLCYFVVVFVLIIAYVVWLIFRTQVQRTLDIQKRELEVARKQVEMGNETILTIARTVDAKDARTSEHSTRVSEYAVRIAQELGYDAEALEQLRKTALLHDIGKIGIPDSILNKPGKLTKEEYDVMKSHVVKGAEILENFTSVRHIVDGALYHHERYDGTGYVHGLKGEEIPLNARIIGIADAFDAMTENRVYRKRLAFSVVLDELRNGRGTQFDPELVDVMLDLIARGEIRVKSEDSEDA